MLYDRLPAGGDVESSGFTNCSKIEIKMEKLVDGGRNVTKVLVLGVGRRVAGDALLRTLGRVLDAVAGRSRPVDVVLAGGDGVRSAACRENSVRLSCSRYNCRRCGV